MQSWLRIQTKQSLINSTYVVKPQTAELAKDTAKTKVDDPTEIGVITA